jgi:small subunit ribosomal protein S8
MDTIADMLTRIRNGLMVGKAEIVLPFSRMKFEIAKILEENGFIEKVEKVKDAHEQIKINLKYDSRGKPAITMIKRVSKPSCRIYVGKDSLPRVQNDLGIAIISTSQGLMTNKEARKRGIGGEVICEVY